VVSGKSERGERMKVMSRICTLSHWIEDQVPAFTALDRSGTQREDLKNQGKKDVILPI
jgi:hypothetical protein